MSRTILNTEILDEVKIESTPIEEYRVKKTTVERLITRRDGSRIRNSIKLHGISSKNMPADALFDKLWLMSKTVPTFFKTPNHTINMADLFCGFGGMSLGVIEAAKALGYNMKPAFAIDFDKDSILTYKSNFPSSKCVNEDISNIIDGNIGQTLTKNELNLKKDLGKIDFLIGGPPCQGNSDLNNHTRRKDPKNDLLLKVVRFAEIFKPQSIIIENVQGVRHDKGNVTEQARKQLEKMGYNVQDGLLLASDFGVAQKRRRYFLVATKNKLFSFAEIVLHYRKEERPFTWACSDLMKKESSSIFDSPAKHSAVNQNRIEYLFNHNLYELPDDQRPECHRNRNHSYKSVYGRMYPDKPSPTITSGFGSIGQGRFCHPFKKRSITPHEAARLQFIPDFFRFLPETKRVSLQQMIGNAVPSKLSYLVALEILR